jgi:hypothetical protein
VSLGNISSFPASVVKENRLEGGCSRCSINIREFMGKNIPKRSIGRKILNISCPLLVLAGIKN